MTIQAMIPDCIALYGSHIRGDADKISDRDILLVHSDVDVLSTASAFLRSKGYSCSTYTWQKLTRMAAHGSLFLQHLKTESLILKDKGLQLEDFLNNFQPYADYSQDLELSKQVVALTENVSAEKASIGWALDILAVAVRNIGVLQLANIGRYVFSFSTILENLLEIGILTRSDVEILQPLRLYKAIYRSRNYYALPDRDELAKIQKTISRCFRVDFHPKILSPEKLTYKLLSESQRENDKYCRFRLLEGAAVPCMEHSEELHRSTAERFLRIVERQNHYSLFWYDLSIPLREVAINIVNYRWGQPFYSTVSQHSNQVSLATF